MSAKDRYIGEVMRRVLAAEDDRARLEDDLGAHFDHGEANGETPREIIRRLGTPDEVAEAFHFERDLEPAGFWLRTAAFVGDMGVIFLLLAPFAAFALWTTNAVDGGAGFPVLAGVALGLAFVAVVGVTVFYFPLLEARFGATLGKHLLAIRVVRETGTPISIGQAFVRRLSLYFELLLADALFIPFTDGKRRALDILAKTLVVREPDREPSVAAWMVCGLLPVVAGLAFAAVIVVCGA